MDATIHPIVYRKGKTRRGRGFSRAELKEVGLSLKEALKMGIPIDPRRRTKHDENIKILKEYLETNLKKAEKPIE